MERRSRGRIPNWYKIKGGKYLITKDKRLCIGVTEFNEPIGQKNAKSSFKRFFSRCKPNHRGILLESDENKRLLIHFKLPPERKTALPEEYKTVLTKYLQQHRDLKLTYIDFRGF